MKNTKLKNGFTLAEVLITLGIIGIVVVMTIPTLIAKINEQITVNKLKEAYSIFNQAYKLAIVENGTPEGWNNAERDSIDGAKNLFEIFKPHMKIALVCQNGSDKCFSKDKYKPLFGDNDFIFQPGAYGTSVSQGMLINGVSFMFWSAGNTVDGLTGNLMIDLNGPKPPNRAGMDYFCFRIADKAFLTYDTSIDFVSSYKCDYNSSDVSNGFLCTGWILKKGNMDYLKRDISNSW
ncbi:type II secretion system protein [bacterium]|nr:type II secretion system protein [bacterium]